MVLSVPHPMPPLQAVELPQEGWDGWLLTQLGSTLDAAILQAMRLAIDATLMPEPREVPALRASAQPFLEGELWDNPRRYFEFVDQPIATTPSGSRYRRVIRGGVVVAREFVSEYQPYHLASQSVAADDRILVEHWMHDQKAPIGTVLALHGFSMGYPRIDAFALFASECFRRGLDVALLTLPFHGARTPPDARYSGERFGGPDMGKMNEAVRQAIYEIHLVGSWLRQQTDEPVGLLGLSLGGYLSALMTSLTENWGFVVPMVPPVCIGDLAWRFNSRSRRYRRGETPAFSAEELRAGYRVHSPLTYSLRIPKERALIVGGRGDQIVPPEHPHALWKHWGEPPIHWFSGSHIAPFRRGRVAQAILKHITSS